MTTCCSPSEFIRQAEGLSRVSAQVNQEAWKNAGAEGLPAVAGLDRAIPDTVAEFLMKQQYVVAQQVMNKDQFDIFKEGWTKVQESPSIQAKQLAFKEVLLHWRPGTL